MVCWTRTHTFNFCRFRLGNSNFASILHDHVRKQIVWTKRIRRKPLLFIHTTYPYFPILILIYLSSLHISKKYCQITESGTNCFFEFWLLVGVQQSTYCISSWQEQTGQTNTIFDSQMSPLLWNKYHETFHNN